ncbi:queuosine biosynthesis protein queC [Rhodococcus sp. IEGM 1381]|uniref:queuosine biosynthesis protein queC n=1 Tax=Rhodococcus sp. IEGM 1381 TaxID=3047085 RepID=UPI0024B7ECF9|nr:queuosine biosynthesis protein queC [Rhodococcus sp. IEGM 1381]MDI9895678.1 queuosine biosynthesis protein queC [Rhodococcus sp. IEGM 1381]
MAADDTPTRSDATALRVPTLTHPSDTVTTDLEWTFSALGNVTAPARDLARIAVAAYLADRTIARSSAYFSRRMEVIVHLDDPDRFLSPTGQQLVNLLSWLTGDAWTLTPVSNQSTATPPSEVAEIRDEVMLLSGGLDSFCGTVASFDGQSSRLHLGHRDHSRAIVHAQDELNTALRQWDPTFAWKRVRIAPKTTRENSTRTRSLMFMTLATAAATAISASRVTVPENGFTSLNPPMLPSRGGALSTKSTHPWTFQQANGILQDLTIPVTLVNPYAMSTKSAMLRAAVDNRGDKVLALASQTISCSKLDGGLGYEGGSPNVNCGLCIACLVRKGAFLGAGLPDATDYLLDRITPAARAKLIDARHADIWAVRTWAMRDPVVDDLIVSAPWPPGTDYDAMLAMVNAGRIELMEALDASL